MRHSDAQRHVLAVAVLAAMSAACGGGSGESADDDGATSTTSEVTVTATAPVEAAADDRAASTSTAVTVTTTDAGEDVPDPAGRIAFGRIMPGHEHSDQLMALYTIDPDGTDVVQLTKGHSAMPDWSPDSTRLAFTTVRRDGSSQIATIAADGSDLRLLTSGPGIHKAPSWSPDGTWIAYDHSPVPPDDPDFHTVLYRMDADGSNQAVFGEPDEFDYEPKIAPDGRSVLFQRWTGKAEPLIIRDLASGRERTVMATGGHNPDWSPDGESIIVQTDPATEGGIWGPLVRISAEGDGSDAVELYPGGDSSGGFKPVYSPDGNHIAFGCGNGAGSPSYDEAICVMNADGSDVEILVDRRGSWENEVSWGVAAP